MIDGAVQLINRFAEPPIGDPADLKALKEDVEILKEERGKSLKLEDETRSRIVMKLAVYYNPSNPGLMGFADRKCPCCLSESSSILAICLYCHSEF